MATASMPASTARNLDYYLQRMSGYSKNTIKIQPQSKFDYFAGDTVIFRLPTNSIIDLHTLALKFSARIANKNAQPAHPAGNTGAQNAALDQAAAIQVSYPQHTSSFIRRFDLTMGGLQSGMGSLHDYGFLYNLLAAHKVPIGRTACDLSVTDDGELPSDYASTEGLAAGGAAAAAVPHTGSEDATYRVPPGGSFAQNGQIVVAGASNPSSWSPKTISSWLGLAGGQFMRFLDTNILPDIEIRILLAPNAILASDQVSASAYQLQNLSFSCESISFGDGSYRAMVDSRMASGEPLLVPFYNWAGFEGSATMQNISQQFTIATESLNAIIGTLRPGNYDAQNLPQIGSGTDITQTSTQSGCSRYIPQVGINPGVVAAPNTTTSIEVKDTHTFWSWYHAALSGERCVNDQFGPTGLWGANYQFNIDSKLYPQFLADVHDAWHLTRNMLDANALSLTYGSQVRNLNQFTQAMFMFAIGLDHHADDGGKDHLISGLNTTGSLIPITFNVNMSNNGQWWNNLRTMCGGAFRPTVFVNMTSTLMIYQGRTISLVN